eukprot:gnl/TRDRNA2_/TRDRNA2_126555_c1_seq1.p1 gnl/TRDRNA2_/TRDRNA2_126555_c1~~gnl/TRDRNA2_/TRDRNA2_126555_c1_seq1.p1  ORF type:complete len:280 (+),score=43.93 gnl/TRDRNA2_/TRDRNA2_126555_c1_seq1:122-841(+)
MYPSTARLFLAQLEDPSFRERRASESDSRLESWDALTATVDSNYSLKLGALRRSFKDESFAYTFRAAWLGSVPPSTVIGESQVLLDLDMHNATNEQLFGWNTSLLLEQASTENPVQGLCGWFDVRFSGHGRSPAQTPIDLDTSPMATPTHWGQTALLLSPPLTSPDLGVHLAQRVGEHHDLNLTLRYGETVASYAITSEFRGYSELHETADDDFGDDISADDPDFFDNFEYEYTYGNLD